MRSIRLDQWLENRAPGGVLAPMRILERMECGGVAWLGNRRLSARGYLVVARQDLWRKVEPEELGVPPTRLLPDSILLVLKPPEEEVKRLEAPGETSLAQTPGIVSEEHERLEKQRSETLGKLTRRLVMAKLEQTLLDRGWGPEQAAEFGDLIPGCEMDEIRQVLARDGRCRQEAPLERVLLEFLPWFGMVASLEPERVGAFFPGMSAQTSKGITDLLESRVRLGLIVAESLDRDHPIHPGGLAADEEQDPYLERHRRLAEEAETQGQWVSAALEQVRESRLCVGKRSENALARARANLRLLMSSLVEPLGLTDLDAEAFIGALDSVLDKAEQGESREEAAFLRQLQAMNDGLANKAYALDVVEFTVSLGVRPWKRQLHYLGLVQVSGRLKTLLGLLPVMRVPDPCRAVLQRVLVQGSHHSEIQVRGVFHPLIDNALDDVGLVAENPLERVARRKIIQELIDRILDQGHITFYDLRDALSRNHLKMQDIRDPAEWLQGDPLLRLDKRLAAPLDGIYRPCPVYSRILEHVTSLGFGTRVGRWLVGKVLIPFGLAALIVVVAATLSEHFEPAHAKPITPLGEATQAVAEVVNAPSDETIREAATKAALTLHKKRPASVVTGINLLAVGILGTVFLLFTNHPTLRNLAWRTLCAMGDSIRWMVHDLPEILPRHPIFLYGIHWPLVILWHGAIKPLSVVLAMFWLTGTEIHWTGPLLFAGWLIATAALMSRQARVAEEWFVGVLREVLMALRSGVLMRALGVLNDLFRTVTRWFDREMANVESLLRVRQRDNTGQLAGRALFSLLWFPLGWLGRFTFVVLIEPMLHPLKLPISFLAAKVIYPVLYPLSTDVAIPALTPMMGALTASLAIGGLVFLLPNAFGFFFWEFRENRGLYEANRPNLPAPDGAGPHGETFAVLLEPGIHGGVLPALYSRLRQASLPATEGGTKAAQRACERKLELLREALGRFFRRNFLDVMGVTHAWAQDVQPGSVSQKSLMLPLALEPGQPIAARQWWRPLELQSVHLAVNRVEATFKLVGKSGLELEVGLEAEPLRIYIAYMENHLQAWIDRPGWVDKLSESKRHALAWSLAWVYRAAGVEIAREPLELLAPTDVEQTKLEGDRILFTTSEGHRITFRLADQRRAWMRVAEAGNTEPTTGTHLAPTELRPAWRAIFGEMPFTWDIFVQRWSADEMGGDFGQTRLDDYWIDLLGDARSLHHDNIIPLAANQRA